MATNFNNEHNEGRPLSVPSSPTKTTSNMPSRASSPRNSVLISPTKSIASVLSSDSGGSPKSNRSPGIFTYIRNSFYGQKSNKRSTTRLTSESVNSLSSMSVNFNSRPDELTDGHVDYVAKAIDVYERECVEYEKRVIDLFEDRYADWYDEPRSDDDERLFQVDHWDYGFIEQWTSMENARGNAKFFLSMCVPKERSQNIDLMEAKFEALEQRLEADYQKALYHKQRYEVFAEKIKAHVKACNDKSALEKLGAENAEKNEALERAKGHLESLSEDLNEAKQTCRAHQRALDKRHSERDLQSNFEHLERIKLYEDRIVELDEQLRQSKLDKQRFANEIFDTEAKLTQARKEIATLQDDLRTSRLPTDQRFKDLLAQNQMLFQRLAESENPVNGEFARLLTKNSDLEESLRRVTDEAKRYEDFHNRAEAAAKVAEDNAQKLKHLEQVHIADAEDRAAAAQKALLDKEKVLAAKEAENLDLLERLKAAETAMDKQKLDSQFLEARLDKREELIRDIQTKAAHNIEMMTQAVREQKAKNAELEEMLDVDVSLGEENLCLQDEVLSLTRQLQEAQEKLKTTSSSAVDEQSKPGPKAPVKTSPAKVKPLPTLASRSTPSRIPPLRKKMDPKKFNKF